MKEYLRQNDRWIIFLLIIFIVLTICDYRERELLDVPKGEYVYQIISPDKKNTAKVYIIYGGILSADAYRVEIENKTKKNKKKYLS